MIIAITANLSACGKDTSAPRGNADRHATATATAARKPCDYVRRADAEKAVGLSLPNTDDDLGLHECRYSTPEFYGSNVTIGDWDQCKTALATDHPSAVAGLGDEAFFVREHLFIRKGDRCVSVEINGPLPDADTDDGLARVEGLARTVLAAL
jgi:hypothetical protein